jgi:hypothetical protein
MKRIVVAALSSSVLVMTGCSADTASPKVESSSKDATPAALVLQTDSPEGTACFDRGNPGDLAVFEFQWKALADLEKFDFQIVGAEGLKQVGPAKTVLPVNKGGQIMFGGVVPWADVREVLGGHSQVAPGAPESVDGWVPIEGQSGLLVLRVRFDDAALMSKNGASYDGVKATYTGTDGSTGEVVAVSDQKFRAGNCE